MMRQNYGIDDMNLRKAQAAFLFAQKIGLLEDPSLEGLERRRQQHNAELRKMEEEGQVFYGPRYFSPAAYLQYELTRLKLDFVEPCAAVRRSGLCPDFTDEEKRAFYEANLDLFGRYHGDYFSYDEVAQIIEKRMREEVYEQILDKLLPKCTQTEIEDAHAWIGENANGSSKYMRTYYVSSKTGDDANDGLRPERAFASLYAVNRTELHPGDQVLLERGSVFHGQFLQITDSGTEEAPIVIGAYGEGAPPRIDTAGQGIWYQDYGNPLDSPTHVYHGYVSSVVLLYDAEYITVEDLEITNRAERILGEHYSQCDKMNRSGVAIIAKDRGVRHGITLRNLSIHDVEGNVYDKHMNNGGIYATALRPTDEEASGIPRYQDMTIEGCFVYRVSRWGTVYEYNYSRQNEGGCVMFCLQEAIHNTFRHNLSYDDLGGTISPSDNPDALLEENVFYVRKGVPFIRKNMGGGTYTEVNNRIIEIEE